METSVRKYLELLWEENKKQNLFSRRVQRAELGKHVLDSMEGLKWMDKPGQSVVDIGSGAGFPAIVLAIYRPENIFHMIESDLKKAQFLREIIDELDLSNTAVICERVEKIGSELTSREKYDFCSSRAVASMRVLLEYGLPLLKLGGLFLMWKGTNYGQQVDESEKALEILGGRVQQIHGYNLMGLNDRVIVAVEKTNITPLKYPRRIGVPVKRPL